MILENIAVYKTWALRSSLIIALLVIVLSLLRAVSIPYTLVRGVVSFGIMYLLLAGSLYLFERGAPPSEYQAESEEEQSPEDDGRGTLFDASVGDDAPQMPEQDLSANLAADPQGEVNPTEEPNVADGQDESPDPDAKAAGQVDPFLSEGMPDAERQAEIVRRMGWE